jgi:hypothetical protein
MEIIQVQSLHSLFHMIAQLGVPPPLEHKDHLYHRVS